MVIDLLSIVVILENQRFLERDINMTSVLMQAPEQSLVHIQLDTLLSVGDFPSVKVVKERLFMTVTFDRFLITVLEDVETKIKK